MSARKRRSTWHPREMQLVNEWLAANFQDATIFTRMRLGTIDLGKNAPPPDSPEARAMTLWRRWADAVVITPRTVYVLEGKIRPDVGVLSQIELYLKLVPVTPELYPYLDRDVKGLLLCAVHDPQLSALAVDKGFEYQVYRPAWVDEYLATLYPRQRRAKGTD